MMKLRQLMSSTLPRNRNKNKKKQQQQQQAEYTKSASLPHPTPSIADAVPPAPNEVLGLNVKYSSPLIGAKGQPRTTPSIKKPRSVSTGTYIKSQEFHRSVDKLRQDILNVNFNVGGVDNKCACHKHIDDTYNDYEELDEVRNQVNALQDAKAGQLAVLSDDREHYTNPRTRSRIKTNPWLPSPRTTPRTSTNTSPDVSPLEPTQTGKLFEDSDSQTVDSGVKGSSDSLCSFNPKSRAWNRSLSDSSLHQSCNSVYSNNINEELPRNIEFKDLSSCENITAEVVQKILGQTPDDRVSFEYEEAFESQVEAHACAYRTRDEFSDGYGSDDDVFLDSREMKKRMELQLQKKVSEKRSRVIESSSDEEEDVVWRRREEPSSAGDTDDTLCEGMMGREAVFLAFDSPIRQAIDEAFVNNNQLTSPAARSLECESIDSALESATSSLDGRTSMVDSGTFSMETSMESACGRSVGEIRSSLQNKVSQLRREKAIVDEKIRQAQEEERLRVQERLRFQKQLTLHRKQLLLSTLADLKSKLELQSERLQTSYTSVLGMQRAAVRSRQQGWAVQMDERKETTF